MRVQAWVESCMLKFKQTTLFGGLAKDRVEHIHKHPANTYEAFIEMCNEFEERLLQASKTL